MRFFSCTLDPILSDPEAVAKVYASCLLITGQPAVVVLGRSVPESPPIYIPDARVTLMSCDSLQDLVYQGNGFYKDSQNRLKLVPGEHYTLNIVLKDGTHISGQTTIPGAFEIFQPTDNDTLFYPLATETDTSRFPKIAWQPSPRAYHYTVQTNSPGNILEPIFTTFRNRTFAPTLNPFSPNTPQKQIIQAKLTVTAVDSHIILDPAPRHHNSIPSLYDFHSRDQYIYLIARFESEMDKGYTHSSPYSNLKGGLGSIGAMHSESRRFFVKFIGTE
jgi:hypothetical protein